VSEVDDDQLAALRRLRAAFGFVEVVEVIDHDPTAPQGEPDWETASQALDDLLRKLLVVHRLLEAEERLAKRERPADPM
jgi:hypothetical protein